jgi:hypothetical protein
MPGHIRQELYKTSSKKYGYHCYPGLQLVVRPWTLIICYAIRLLLLLLLLFSYITFTLNQIFQVSYKDKFVTLVFGEQNHVWIQEKKTMTNNEDDGLWKHFQIVKCYKLILVLQISSKLNISNLRLHYIDCEIMNNSTSSIIMLLLFKVLFLNWMCLYG